MFRYSICDPLKRDVIEMGKIEKAEILDVLEKFPWTALLEKMDNARESDVHYSPSLEFENTLNRHSLSISIINDKPENEFYIFYKRPKRVTRFFGLIRYFDENYLTDRQGQTDQDVLNAVTALLNNDLNTLEKNWG